MKISILTLLLCLLAGVAQAAPPSPHVHIRLIPENTNITPGQTMLVGVEETIDPGWHTYWVNPGDSGQAPVIKWNLPEGFTTGDLKWPVPEKMAIGPTVEYGYQNKVTLLQEVTAASKFAKGPLKVSASVEILVCKDICIPEISTQEFVFNNNTATDNSDIINAAFDKTPDFMPDWPATFRDDRGDFRLDVRILQPGFTDTMDLKKPIYMLPLDWGVIGNAERPHGQLRGNILSLEQTAGQRPLKDLPDVRMLVVYTDVQGAQRALSFKAAPDPLWLPPPESKSGVKLSLIGAMALALLGGVILNLMPCVFPVLSLKALKLCSLSGQERQTARRASFAYAAGILVSFAVLAATFAALRAGGVQVGWGFQLQNPGFVLPLAWLLFVIGLNLSGVFEIGGRWMNLGHSWTAGQGLIASFSTGVLAAVVATPCTAPFMGAALGYALTQPTVITFAVLLALGLGLALPLILLACVPGWRAVLPKPGAWMVTLRELLAFPMYASAAWLVWVLSLEAGAVSVMNALGGAVAIAFGLWLLGKRPATRRIYVWSRAAALFSLLLALSFVPAAVRLQKHAEAASATGEWMPFSSLGLTKLEQENDPIFIDMTAAWCITCKVNESTVLDSAAIVDLFHQHHVQTVRGDWTNMNPEITTFLDKFGRRGVPLYVYYGPRDANGHKRPAAIVLPQLLTAGVIENMVGK